MVDALYVGFALGHDSGHDERYASAQVGAHHMGAGNRLAALDDHFIAYDDRVHAHAVHLADVRESVEVDVVDDSAIALRAGQEDGPLRLEVSRKAGVDTCFNRNGANLVRRDHGDIIRSQREGRACPRKGIDESVAQMGRLSIGDMDDVVLRTRDRRQDHEGAEFDPVRCISEFNRIQCIDALNLELRGAQTVDLCAHRLQHLSEHHHVRLTRGILDPRRPFGGNGSEEEVDRGSHARWLQPEDAAFETTAPGPGHYIAFLEIDLGAQRHHPLHMQVHGTRSPRTAAWERNAGRTATAEKGAQHVEGGTHLLDEIVRRLGEVHARGIDLHRVRDRIEPDRRTRDAQDVREGRHVPQIRDVRERGGSAPK